MKSGGYFTFHSAKIVGGQNKMKSFKTEEEIQTIRIPAKKKEAVVFPRKTTSYLIQVCANNQKMFGTLPSGPAEMF